MDPPEYIETVSHASMSIQSAPSQQSHSSHGTSDPTLRNRRATQWHPAFDPDHSSSDDNNPGDTAMTSSNNDNTMLSILQSLAESNQKLQDSLVSQQNLLASLVKLTLDKCESQKELTKALLNSSSSKSVSRVPHFEPSSNEGISLSQSSIPEIGKPASIFLEMTTTILV